MSVGANVRHSLGLLFASVGGVGLVVSVGVLAAGFNGNLVGVACGIVGVLLSTALVWRGIKMRNRAAKDSTIFKEDDGVQGPTSVTGKSPIPKKRKPGDDDW
jgi:hypothetical protein